MAQAKFQASWMSLARHPSTPGDATRGVDAAAQIDECGTAVFRYVLRAEMSRLRIAPTQSAERADDLWKHTCFEAFIAVPGAPGYYELNFAPSRQWSVYRFDEYRKGMASPVLDAPPELSVRRFADRLEVVAAVRLPDLIGLRGMSHFRVGLSAVVEEDSGTLSYWALKHGFAKADFHCAEGFALDITLQGGPEREL